MATRIQTWQIIDGQLQQIETTLSEVGRTETYDLEKWVASNPSIIGQDIMIIGRQVQTSSGPLDLLAIDKSGTLVIVELKRDTLPREALAQAVDYASDVSTWSIDKLSEVCTKFTSKSLEDSISEGFPDINLENLNINESQRIILVGFAIESSLERMINWLSDSFNVDINAVVLHYVRTSSGDELLTKTTIISDGVVEQRGKSRRLRIPMSDEPGQYKEQELRMLLAKYLSQEMVSAQRIRDVLLPVCLSNEVVRREQLKQELVSRRAADDTSKAGYFLTVISGQIGMEKNDFLRQVIGYEYPTYSWEKDNYHIRQGYRDLVNDVLCELNTSLYSQD